jgi:hypothetical protein
LNPKTSVIKNRLSNFRGLCLKKRVKLFNIKRFLCINDSSFYVAVGSVKKVYHFKTGVNTFNIAGIK